MDEAVIRSSPLFAELNDPGYLAIRDQSTFPLRRADLGIQ